MNIQSIFYALTVILTGVSLLSGAILDASAAAPQLKQWREVFQPGGLIGYVDANGYLKVRAHADPVAPWITLAKNVKDFQLTDTRIAVRQNDGTLRIGDGPLDNMRWEVIDTEAAAYQLGVSRVGILHRDGTFLVTDWGTPIIVATGVRAFQVLPDRVGILGLDGSFWVQEGLSTEKFHKIADKTLAFQMDHEWIAYIQVTDSSTRLMLGRGQVAGMQFSEQAVNVTDFEMEVWVDASNRYEHRVRLAHVSGANIIAGSGHLERKIKDEGFYNHLDMKEVPGMQAKNVHWAGGRIIAEDEYGTVTVAEMSKDGTLGASIVTGKKEDIRWNSEGAVLVRQSDRHLLFHPKPVDGESEASVLVIGMEGPDSRLAQTGEVQIELSSRRPTFVRRPMTMKEEIGSAAVVQSVDFPGKIE